ncbi:hypothetical protein T12_4198, partial [Trichinella patagoniensis]
LWNSWLLNVAICQSNIIHHLYTTLMILWKRLHANFHLFVLCTLI